MGKRGDIGGKEQRYEQISRKHLQLGGDRRLRPHKGLRGREKQNLERNVVMQAEGELKFLEKRIINSVTWKHDKDKKIRKQRIKGNL